MSKKVKCQQYSALNMCVFRVRLNSVRFPLHFMWNGSRFHNRGPITSNARSPKLTSFVRGTCSRYCWDERVRPAEHCLFSMFSRYNGPVPFRHRYTCIRILNSIRHFTGSQCSSFRIGVMWSRRGVRVMILAAMFWMRWSLFKCSSGSPASSAFP